MGPAPTGTVTFMFTDIEGSTALWQRHGRAMDRCLLVHDDLVRSAIERSNGVVFATGGDGMAAAFQRAEHAISAAIEAQRRLLTTAWAGPTLRVRIGMHTGEAHERGGDYFGPAVNLAARVCHAANGTQILLSGTTAGIVADHVAPGVALVDLGAHLLRDVVAPVRLLRVSHPDLGDDLRPPRTGSVTTGNLPARSISPVGRDADLDAVLQSLDQYREVTIVGIGGIGKTTVALEVGRRCQPTMPDGVWIARLDQVAAGGGVVELLTGIFGLDASGGRSASAPVLDALRYRRALLVLDNCEHVVDDVAALVEEILESCPDVRLLATSRVPLEIAGEWVVQLPPLDTGVDGAAAKLFVERAAAAGTAGTDADREVISEICRRLEGIPLAIELVAARARTLRPEEILSRLDDMLPMLGTGRRRGGRDDRHPTMVAAIAWSTEAITDEARRLLADLTVFAGSFSLDAIEVVADADGALELLDELVVHSLVAVAAEGEHSRYRVLEPVRHFVAERLIEERAFDAASDRHAGFYGDLIWSLSERWRGGDDQSAWPVAQRELPNLRRAFDQLCARGRVDEAQRFAVAAFGPIVCHFDNIPQDEWAPRALSLDEEHIGPWTASACAVAVWGALVAGDHDSASRLMRRGLGAIDAGSIDDGLLFGAAMHAVTFGADLSVPREFIDSSIAEARATDDLFRKTWVLGYARLAEEAMAAAEALGNQMLMVMARTGLNDRSADDPRSLLEDAWQIAERAHSVVARNSTAQVYGSFEIVAGIPGDGLLFLRPAAREWLLHGDARVWEVLHTMAAGFARLGDHEAVRTIVASIGARPVGTHVGPVLHRLERRYIEQATGPSGTTPPTPLDVGSAVAFACRRAEQLVSRNPIALTAEEAGLSEQHLTIAELLAKGLSNRDIARALGLGRSEVGHEVDELLRRLGATSRIQVTEWLASTA